MHASAEYRRHLTGVLVRRAAAARLRDGGGVRELSLTVNGRARARARRRSTPAVGLPPALARPARHARRLRARRLRRLHGAARRPRRALLPDARRPGRGLPRRDGRVAGRSGGPALAAAGLVPAPPRAAVRLLHARHPHERRRAAGRRRHADAARDRGAALGPPLPLHGLRVDRGCHRRGRGDRARESRRASPGLRGAPSRALALVDGERRATYARAARRGARAPPAAWPRAASRPGDRVAATLKNRFETVSCTGRRSGWAPSSSRSTGACGPTS